MIRRTIPLLITSTSPYSVVPARIASILKETFLAPAGSCVSWNAAPLMRREMFAASRSTRGKEKKFSFPAAKAPKSTLPGSSQSVIQFGAWRIVPCTSTSENCTACPLQSMAATMRPVFPHSVRSTRKPFSVTPSASTMSAGVPSVHSVAPAPFTSQVRERMRGPFHSPAGMTNISTSCRSNSLSKRS